MVSGYTIALLGAALLALVAALSSWRRRSVPGGLAFTLMLTSIVVWCSFSALETTSTSEAQRYLWSALSYVGLCNVAPFFLVFTLQYSGARPTLPPLVLAGVWAIPAATIALAFTNGSHHLIWTSVSASPIVGANIAVYGHGVWYWVETLCFLAMCGAASFILARMAIRTARLYALQSAALLLSVLFPWIGLLLYVLPNGPLPGLDTTSLGFALSAILITLALYRFRLFDLVPQARSTLVEGMEDGFIVVDGRGRIIDINRAACGLFEVSRDVVGEPLSATLPFLIEPGEQAERRGGKRRDLTLQREPPVHLEITLSSMGGRTAGRGSHLILVRDVTERRRSEIEREQLITNLTAALEDVKTLSGLLPICAGCRKVRDDKGYWTQLEQYITSHSEAKFSHGLCPDCMRRLYPDLAGAINDEGAGTTQPR